MAMVGFKQLMGLSNWWVGQQECARLLALDSHSGAKLYSQAHDLWHVDWPVNWPPPPPPHPLSLFPAPIHPSIHLSLQMFFLLFFQRVEFDLLNWLSAECIILLSSFIAAEFVSLIKWNATVYTWITVFIGVILADLMHASLIIINKNGEDGGRRHFLPGSDTGEIMKRSASRYETVGAAAVVVSGVVDAVIGVVVAAVSRVVR